MRLKFYAARPVGGFVTHFGTDGGPLTGPGGGAVVTDTAPTTTTTSHILMNGSQSRRPQHTTPSPPSPPLSLSPSLSCMHIAHIEVENISRQHNTNHQVF